MSRNACREPRLRSAPLHTVTGATNHHQAAIWVRFLIVIWKWRHRQQFGFMHHDQRFQRIQLALRFHPHRRPIDITEIALNRSPATFLCGVSANSTPHKSYIALPKRAPIATPKLKSINSARANQCFEALSLSRACKPTKAISGIANRR